MTFAGLNPYVRYMDRRICRYSYKSEVIAYVMESCGIADKNEVIMVGDREHDILGAKAAGIASLGVLFGYGSREELEAAGADALAENACRAGEILVAI